MLPERYARQEAIVGADGQRLLAEKKVRIVGCGGLGGHLIENMLRIGVGSVLAVDPDRFEASNLNRQLLCTEAFLGASKAKAAAERAKSVNPEVAFRAVSDAFSAQNGDELAAGCDLVLDGLDSVPDRLTLEDVCARQNVPIVHGAILGETVQVAVVPPRSGMLRTLYSGAAPQARPADSIAYTPACCAAIQSAQALKLLLGHRPALWGKVLLLDMDTMTEEILPLSGIPADPGSCTE
jgi:molybdopterin/thiamine biosynthesis adenylyltransferase